MGFIFCIRSFFNVVRRPECVPSGVDENYHLVIRNSFHHFFVEYFIEHHHFTNSFLFSDPTIKLLKWNRPIALIKIE